MKRRKIIRYNYTTMMYYISKDYYNPISHVDLHIHIVDLSGVLSRLLPGQRFTVLLPKPDVSIQSALLQGCLGFAILGKLGLLKQYTCWDKRFAHQRSWECT
jgi:hypothetical protein